MQMQYLAGAVAQHLDLDMARALDEPLGIDPAVAEVTAEPRSGEAGIFGQLLAGTGDLHALCRRRRPRP